MFAFVHYNMYNVYTVHCTGACRCYGTHQERTQGGGAEVAPLGVFGPCGPNARENQNSCEGIRNPRRSHEICAETHQKTRPESRGPSDHLGLPRKRVHQKNRAPLSIRGSSEYQDPSEHQGPFEHQSPLSASGAPLSIRGPPFLVWCGL